MLRSCDLLSIFDVLIFASTGMWLIMVAMVLWFAFNLWRSDICFNVQMQTSPALQLWFAFNLWRSDICFNHFLKFITEIVLWFAFNLWRSDICFNHNESRLCFLWVVICFQSLTFWYLLQHERAYRTPWMSCDLLSIFDVLIFASTLKGNINSVERLWFAFNLWRSDICFNPVLPEDKAIRVVICFQSLTFWYLLQLHPTSVSTI